MYPYLSIFLCRAPEMRAQRTNRKLKNKNLVMHIINIENIFSEGNMKNIKKISLSSIFCIIRLIK